MGLCECPFSAMNMKCDDCPNTLPGKNNFFGQIKPFHIQESEYLLLEKFLDKKIKEIKDRQWEDTK